MGIEYNKNILQTVEEVRRRITDRVQSMTGLRIKELNATITDITFPEKEVRRRIGPRSETTEHDTSADETAIAPASPATPDSEPGASERDTMRVETAANPRARPPQRQTQVRRIVQKSPQSRVLATREQRNSRRARRLGRPRRAQRTKHPSRRKRRPRPGERRRAEERARRRTEDS